MAALFFWAVLGALIGGFVKSVFWFESSRGWLGCTVFGIAGGIAGGALRGAAHAFDLTSMGLCVLGAAVLLFGYGLATARSRATQVERRRAA